jgi:archaemetzincin
LIGSCNERAKFPVIKSIFQVPQNNLIILQPIGKFPKYEAENLFTELVKVYPNCKLNTSIPFPENCYYSPRNRFRADSAIKWLCKTAKKGEVYLAITHSDISTTKDDKLDWGVMGLGYRPGKACIASSFRLKNKKNFFKVMVHELGHTAGLPHCPDSTCFMADAKGGDPTGNETGFCQKCSNILKNKSWKL